jgi:hypothetical protein
LYKYPGGEGLRGMLRVGKSILAGLVGSFACMAAGDAGAGLAQPGEHNQVVRYLERRPMIFFVAKGPDDSCGAGCSEWIAAVGQIDSGTADRFRALLGKLDGRKLPVFFHSPGGISGSGIRIGYDLRERRMRAGIGRTEAKCRVFDKSDRDCQEKIKAGVAIPARLVTGNAACTSACVYAFAGASTRQVASGAVLGVHTPKFVGTKPTIPTNVSRKRQQEIIAAIRSQKPDPVRIADYIQVERRYYTEMGIDPGLVDIAFRTPHERMYLLDRKELARFGLETRSERYETPWITSNVTGGQHVVMKTLTRRNPANPAEHLTTQLRFICSADKKLYILYRRELPNDPAQTTDLLRAAFDDSELEFRSLNTRAGVETGGFASSLKQDSLTRMAAAKNLIVTEKMKAGGQETLETKFSNTGLEAALRAFRSSCNPANEIPPELFRPGFSPAKWVPVKPIPVRPARIPPAEMTQSKIFVVGQSSEMTRPLFSV